MAKIITATIDPATGEVEVLLDGYKGKGCHAVQDVITKALGGEVLVDKKLPEYNAVVTNTVCAKR